MCVRGGGVTRGGRQGAIRCWVYKSYFLLFFLSQKAVFYNTNSISTRSVDLLPALSEDRGVLGVGSIPVSILPSCQDMKTIAL